jgi:hypothetical protein
MESIPLDGTADMLIYRLVYLFDAGVTRRGSDRVENTCRLEVPSFLFLYLCRGGRETTRRCVSRLVMGEAPHVHFDIE